MLYQEKFKEGDKRVVLYLYIELFPYQSLESIKKQKEKGRERKREK